MQVKVHHSEHLRLAATSGWDALHPRAHTDLAWILSKNGNGVMGAVNREWSPEAPDAAKIGHKDWHCISLTVDLCHDDVRVYVDGRPDLRCFRCVKATRDGQFSLKAGQLALLYGNDFVPNSGSKVYLRMCTVHSRVLNEEQVSNEHAMMNELLIADALEEIPAFVRPSLISMNDDSPFTTTRALRQRMREIIAAAFDVAEHLWVRLEPPGKLAECDDALSEIEEHSELALAFTLAVCARWSRVDAMSHELLTIEETVAPHGETLLHRAAFVGATGLLERLVAAGGDKVASRRGANSRCTPLHSAVSGGQVAACRILLKAGCNVNAISSAKHTALSWACAKDLAEIAECLVAEGGADPHDAPAGSFSPRRSPGARMSTRRCCFPSILESRWYDSRCGQ